VRGDPAASVRVRELHGAVQIAPEIAGEVSRLHVFQRTANWVLPKEDDPYTPEEIAARRADPGIVAARREELFNQVDKGMAFKSAKVRAGMEETGLAALEAVNDPELRAKLTPDHPWGCKRPLFHNEYYTTFNRPNVELVTDPIERITARGVLTGDGTERVLDTIVLATGFATTKYLSAIEVSGRDGLDIADAWNDGATAYRGVTTSGFPNLFMLYGPNTNNGSIITMIEYQVEYVVAHVRRIAEQRLAWVDVRAEPMARYNDWVQEGIAGVEPWHGGCNGYYRTPNGRIVTQWPHNMTTFKNQTSTIDESAYESAALGGRTLPLQTHEKIRVCNADGALVAPRRPRWRIESRTDRSMCILKPMRLHIQLEDDLVDDLDRRAGSRRRSAFIAALIRRSLEDERRWDEIEESLGSITDIGHDWDEDPGRWVRAQRRSDPMRSG